MYVINNNIKVLCNKELSGYNYSERQNFKTVK